MNTRGKRIPITKSKRSRRTSRLGKSFGPAVTGKVRIVDASGGRTKVVYDAGSATSGSRKPPLEKFGPSLSRAMKSAARDFEGVDLIVVGREEVEEPIASKWSIPTSKMPLRPSAGEGFRVRTDALIERMLPDSPVPTPAQALQAQRNGEARWALMEEFGAYTSEEIAEHRSRAKNKHALASRWRSEGRVFSVDYHGRRLFPGFQFELETLVPKPVVADALAALPREEMSEWEVAMWWSAANGWLGGARPVDLMDGDEGAVVEAAAHLAEPSPL